MYISMYYMRVCVYIHVMGMRLCTAYRRPFGGGHVERGPGLSNKRVCAALARLLRPKRL